MSREPFVRPDDHDPAGLNWALRQLELLGVPDPIARNEEAAALIFDGYCGWRRHPMLSYPIVPHPDVNKEAIKGGPKAYARTLERSGCDESFEWKLSGADSFEADSYRLIRPICTIPWGSPLVEDFLEAQIPVVIRGSKLIRLDGKTSATEFNSDSTERYTKWSPDYIRKILKDSNVDVYQSKGKYFRYWKRARHKGNYNFTPPTELSSMSFLSFLQEASMRDPGIKSVLSSLNEKQDAKSSREISRESHQQSKDKGLLYMQESLSGHPELADEFSSWDWEWLLKIVRKFGWGIPDRNILLVGMKWATTPAHYDEQENMFCQVRGKKEVYLWPPGDWRSMYAFPVNHACDRQSMVNPDNPDLKRFPRYRFSRPHHAVLQAGDLLYLPVGWWHHLRNLDPLSVSITFWSKQKKILLEQLQLPLHQKQLLTVRRNLEEMVCRSAGQEALADLFEKLEFPSPPQPWKFKGRRESKIEGEKISSKLLKHPSAHKTFSFMRSMLANFMPDKEAAKLVLYTIEGRYGKDIEKWVQPTPASVDI